MTWDTLRDRFPKMTRIKGTPPLFRLNGCGVGLYGSRDHDPATGSYVATLCISLLFIPVFCLRAYRVARAPGGGWYFLGGEPLSKLAKWFNILLIVAIAGSIGAVQYAEYVSSPGYRARQQMTQAKNLLAQGHFKDAASIYQNQIQTHSSEEPNAMAALHQLITNDCKAAPLDESAGVFAIGAQVARREAQFGSGEFADAGMKLVADKGDSNPRAAVAILDSIRPLILDTRDIDSVRLTLLQKWVDSNPGNPEAIVPLASILAEQHDQQADQKAKKLLLPIKDKLGDGEGARVLGMILGREGDFDGAYALLWPYAKSRLDGFHDAELNLTRAWNRVNDNELRLLKDNKGPQSFYDKLEGMSQAQREAAVDDYLAEKVKTNPDVARAQESLRDKAKIVPVALELGMIMLQRAQLQSNSDARKQQLQSAEQVFLAVKGLAGETDQYRLSLGQVDYWLGKQIDGKKLFDDYLSSKSRSYESLMEVAERLHELGSGPDSRTMCEEAYKAGSAGGQKFEAAHLRASCFKDTDDQIVWLNKANPANPSVKARLALVQGRKAFEEGRDDEAVRQFRAAIEAYRAIPRNATTLNDTAIAYDALFGATGDSDALQKCLDYFQQAVDLEPSDSILLYNAGSTLVTAALSDVAGKQIDVRALRESGSTSLLGFLYRDAEGRAAVIKRVKDHPGIARGLSYLQKAMILSPKSERSFSVITPIDRFMRDQDALRDIATRLKATDLDTSDQLAELKDYLGGVRDQQDRTTLNAAVKRSEDVAGRVQPIGGVTAAVALCRQAERLMELETFDGTCDPAKIEALLREAHRLAPSTRTASLLISSTLLNSAKRLSAQNPAFAAFYKQHRRTLALAHLMGVAASEPSPYQASVQADPDVKAAVQQVIEQDHKFPDDCELYEWALLSNMDNAEASKMAEAIRGNSQTMLDNSISNLLSPLSTTTAMETYWLMKLTGKPADARAAIRKVTDQGISMPVNP